MNSENYIGLFVVTYVAEVSFLPNADERAKKNCISDIIILSCVYRVILLHRTDSSHLK